MQAVQTKTSLPTLWTSDEEVVMELFLKTPLEDLRDLPEVIEPGIHIILVDEKTQEALVRRAIYKMVEFGITPQIYKCRGFASTLIQDIATTKKEFLIQTVEFSQDAEIYLAKLDTEKLTILEASSIARVILKYSKMPKAELEALRLRCSASSFSWNGIVKEIQESIFEQQFREVSKNAPNQSVNPTSQEKAKKIKLEISNWLRITDPILQDVERTRILSSYHIRGDSFERLCKAQRIAENESAFEPKLQTLKEFLNKEQVPVSFLVNGYCLKKSSVVFSGLPGSGKTLIALQLAYAVATGGKFMGEECSQAPVIFYCADQPSNITRHYIKEMGLDELDNFHIVTEENDGKEDERSANWNITKLDVLEKHLDQVKPGLVVIDSIRTTICNPLGLEEKSEIIGHWIKEVERLVCRYGTLIYIHHDNKDAHMNGISRASGSTAITGSVSACWRVERASKEDTDLSRILSMPKTRGFEPICVNLHFNIENSCFEFAGLKGESEEVAKQKQSYQDKILKFLSCRPGIGFEMSEITLHTGIDKNSLYTVLGRMTSKGIIGCRRSKSGSKNKVWYVEYTDIQCIELKKEPSPPVVTQNNVSYEAESNIQQEIPSSNNIPNTSSNTLEKEGVRYEVLDESESSNGKGFGHISNTSNSKGGGGAGACDSEHTPNETENFEPISLLQIEESEGNVAGFIGMQVEARNISGAVKFCGELVDYDALNGSVKVNLPNGETKNCSVREVFVL